LRVEKNKNDVTFCLLLVIACVGIIVQGKLLEVQIRGLF